MRSSGESRAAEAPAPGDGQATFGLDAHPRTAGRGVPGFLDKSDSNLTPDAGGPRDRRRVLGQRGVHIFALLAILLCPSRARFLSNRSTTEVAFQLAFASWSACFIAKGASGGVGRRVVGGSTRGRVRTNAAGPGGGRRGERLLFFAVMLGVLSSRRDKRPASRGCHLVLGYGRVPTARGTAPARSRHPRVLRVLACERVPQFRDSSRVFERGGRTPGATMAWAYTSPEVALFVDPTVPAHPFPRSLGSEGPACTEGRSGTWRTCRAPGHRWPWAVGRLRGPRSRCASVSEGRKRADGSPFAAAGRGGRNCPAHADPVRRGSTVQGAFAEPVDRDESAAGQRGSGAGTGARAGAHGGARAGAAEPGEELLQSLQCHAVGTALLHRARGA